MKFVSIRRKTQSQLGIEGILLVLAAVPLVFGGQTLVLADKGISYWQLAATAISALLFLASATLILRRPELGKPLALAATTSSLVSLFPVLKAGPSAALAGLVSFFLVIHFLVDFRIQGNLSRAEDQLERMLQRTRLASFTLIALSLISFLVVESSNYISEAALIGSAFFCQMLAVIWSIRQDSNFNKLASIVFNTLTFTLIIFLNQRGFTWVGTLVAGLAIIMLLPDSAAEKENVGSWYEPLMNHPGRVTLATFLILCLIGNLLLMLPGAAVNKIALVDAAFTSVSAVCVTGLIVLDTPNDFSLLGQFFILLLIQLGGLGIMTITTFALHALGRRLSLKQERMLHSTYNSDYLTLAASLKQIVWFTAIMESIGALVLSLLFFRTGLSPSESAWKGLFTSISAFCNAGFSLQTDSLIPYQDNPLILHAVAILIICGGIAPAVTLTIPRWLRGGAMTVASRLALITTFVLLAVGTIFFLAFEWNGALQGMAIADKFHNAWFQSVTLRTAGFNSIPLESVIGPTFLMMICMMFIGGSPGGTAGGVKTTTVGVLAATFWSCAAGYDDISMQNRRVLPQTVFKAVTIVTSGTFLLFLITLMLEATQNISARDLIFEAASALGTVGLSTGATGKLDSIGKIIIMLAMFAGRIGPVTLFTLLSRERPGKAENLLEARINLT